MAAGDPFFGGQVTAEVFAEIAQTAPTVDVGQYSTNIQGAFNEAMTDAITTGKSAEDAYRVGVAKANG